VSAAAARALAEDAPLPHICTGRLASAPGQRHYEDHSMRITIIAAALALLAASPVLAHHGWSTYDATGTVVLEAPIQEVRYQSPHGEIELEADGKHWLIILAPPSRMERRGLPASDLTAGKTVKVEGYPSRVHEGEMRAERITVDGRTIELR
jgi:hypothetical protein